MIPLEYVGDDENWHYFEISVRYDPNRIDGKVLTIEKIVFDGKNFDNLGIPAWTMRKNWRSSFWVLLETGNMYPNCMPNDRSNGLDKTVGGSRWDKLSVKYKPLSE